MTLIEECKIRALIRNQKLISHSLDFPWVYQKEVRYSGVSHTNVDVSICSSHNFHSRSFNIHISYKLSITSSHGEPNALLAFNSDSGPTIGCENLLR